MVFGSSVLSIVRSLGDCLEEGIVLGTGGRIVRHSVTFIIAALVLEVERAREMTNSDACPPRAPTSKLKVQTARHTHMKRYFFSGKD